MQVSVIRLSPVEYVVAARIVWLFTLIVRWEQAEHREYPEKNRFDDAILSKAHWGHS